MFPISLWSKSVYRMLLDIKKIRVEKKYRKNVPSQINQIKQPAFMQHACKIRLDTRTCQKCVKIEWQMGNRY